MLKNKMLSISTLIVFVLSAILTVPALADGGSTPPATGTSSGGRTANTGSSSNSVSQVRSGAKVVVVDASGNKLPLGSQAAQDIINSGDPIWCPSSVSKPLGSGLNGCTDSESDLYTLISDINLHTAGVIPNANGTIWIQQGTESPSGAAIVIDGDNPNFNNWKNFTLTIKGGWNGVYGSSLTPGASTVQDPLEIANWNNAVIVSNVQVSNVQVENATGTGLYIMSTKTITLTNVAANNNPGYGAYLDDSSGTGVTITGSSFNGNGVSNLFYYGLDVWAHGPILVTNTSASGNLDEGAYLDNTAGTAGVTLHGTNTFSSNMDDGLRVNSNGAIVSNSLIVDANAGSGAILDNHSASAHQPVALSGSSSFDANTGGDGLDIYSTGAIQLNAIDASSNAAGFGAIIDNCDFNGSICPGTGAVTLTGTSTFIGNFADGLAVVSHGAISVNNISADSNLGGGGVLNNANSGATAGVSLTSANSFNGNDGGDGLAVSTNGAVKLNDVVASANIAGNGVYVNNDSVSAQPVTLTGYLTASNNYYYGLHVQTKGSITGEDLTVGSNNTSLTDADGGAFLDTTPGTGGVTLTGTNIFENNLGYGLEILSRGGAVNLHSVIAYWNVGPGLLVDNSGGTGIGQGVTLTGVNDISYNSESAALLIYSRGAVSLTDIRADNNAYGSGTQVDNTFSTAASPRPVTVSGTNSFNNNGRDGLQVKTYGAILLNNVTADGNGSTNYVFNSGYGANLDNSNATSPASVTLTGVNNFNDNHNDGLNIVSKGSVSLTRITADGNAHGSGLDAVTQGTITLTCGNFVINRWLSYYGVYLASPAKMTLIGVTASDNTTNISTNGGGAVVTVSACPLP